MKLLTFKYQGQQRLGWLQKDGQSLLSVRPDRPDLPQSIMKLIESGPDACEALVSARADLDEYRMEDVKILAPIEPRSIFCIGLNYSDHAAELALAKTSYPTLFWRLPRNHVAHAQPIWVPALSQSLDWEGELVAVIGKGGRYIASDNALDHVFGYSIYNDGSVREYQNHSTQFGLGKNFQASGAFGPVIVTADEFGNPYEQSIETRLNGEIVQSATIDSMLHRIEDVIAYLSSSMELLPGDIICTGTPSGVGAGRQPPVFMAEGDLIEVSISGIGTLSNPVKAEPAELMSMPVNHQ